MKGIVLYDFFLMILYRRIFMEYALSYDGVF